MSSTAFYVTTPAPAASSTQNRGWWYTPALAIVTGLTLLAMATVMLLRGIEPVATWYYNFAWWPVLLAGDGLIALTGGAGRGQRGEFLLLGRKDFLATLLAWSAVVWLFYELFNFRLQNWYYVFLPEPRLERWAGTVLAFATVLPAVLIAEGVLHGLGVAHNTRWRSFTVTSRVITTMRAAGVVMLALVLIWPKYFFPLVWGATMLLVEPENYKRSREHSLLADLEQGRPSRLLRLLLGGACIGFIWELLNINARGKWIYTVPGLEDIKLFEMPVPGFFGFPPFAVECFILWQALILAGLAVPRWGSALHATTGKRISAAAVAVVFSVGVLIGMERMTVDSYKPTLRDVVGTPAANFEIAGYDVFSLARATPHDVALVAGAGSREAIQWIERARLATLRGMGTEYLELLRVLGINSTAALAAQDPARLAAALEQLTGRDLVEARVRVWVRGAKRASYARL